MQLQLNAKCSRAKLNILYYFKLNISQYAVEFQTNAKCSRAGLESVERKHRASAAQMKYWGNKSEKKPVLEEEGALHT